MLLHLLMQRSVIVLLSFSVGLNCLGQLEMFNLNFREFFMNLVCFPLKVYQIDASPQVILKGLKFI